MKSSGFNVDSHEYIFIQSQYYFLLKKQFVGPMQNRNIVF